MAVLVSADVVGKKESVNDVINRVAREETVFISSIKEKKVENTLHQWLEESLVAPTGIALADGADAVDNVGDQPVMRSNVTQIVGDSIKVSRTADRVSKYGREKEINRLVVKRGLELRIDLEYSAVGTKQAAVTSGTRKFAGVQALIDLTTNKVSTGGTTTAMTEAKLMDALELLYVGGATPKAIMVTPADARVISGFASSSGRTRDFGNDSVLTNVIDLLKTPFGQTKVVLNTRLATTDTLIYNPSNWKLGVLDGWFKEPLAKVGDSTRYFVAGEFTLEHAAQKASAIIRKEA